MGLAEGSRRPLAAVVGRLLDRKGLDILAPSLEHLMDMGLELVVMGYGEDHYHAFLQALNRRRPDRLALKIGYRMDLAHKIMAGADLLLMPSRYEPCGLHQMQAMRYGAVPVVRATGGLRDTVDDHTEASPGTGFRFEEFTSAALLSAVARALDCFQDPGAWQGVMRRAMARDFSWERAATAYEDVYRRAVDLHSQGGA
jgi:starch synthase